MPPVDPEQLTLFELGVDMGKLKELRRGLDGHRRAPATLRALESDWRHFLGWCQSVGRRPLPAAPETLELYLTHCGAELEHKVSTLERRLWAISQAHQRQGQASPVTPGSRQVIRAIARQRGRKPEQKAALTPEQLRAMVRTCGRDRAGVRDRAVLLVGFASGLRRSELAGLQLGDVEYKPKGVLLHLARSKTDQEGNGRTVGVLRAKAGGLCAVGALTLWIRRRGRAPGPLFGIAGETVADIVKRCAERAGLDASHLAAHSLRAGMITALDAAGVSVPAIMSRSGHRSVAMVARYVRHRDPFAFDPLSLGKRRRLA